MKSYLGMEAFTEQLSAVKVVPVITIDDASIASELGKVLTDNGLPCAEIVFRTEAAADAIAAMRDANPEMLLGAGTVLTMTNFNAAISAGVDFIVSPGYNTKIVRACQDRGIPMIPGVNSPSQVELAMEERVNLLKFFPAEPSGGIAMLKALSSVYPVRFMPTGGIGPANVENYLALSSVVACGGSWLTPAAALASRDWDTIGKLVRQAVAIVAKYNREP